MSRMILSLVAVLLVAAVCDAASLVRFINTVPTRTPQTSRTGTGIATGTFYANREVAYNAYTNNIQSQIDRVGLLYTVTSGTAQSATTVWTELHSETETGVLTTPPYSWVFGMPPLRAYHGLLTSTPSISEPSLVDTVANNNAANQLGVDVTCDDFVTQSALKADGVGLYLSFAAGTYNIGAYGVRGDATLALSAAEAGQRFTSADTTFTFADNMVYTLVAIGNGNYGNSNGQGSFGDTASVTLVLLAEQTGPTTFGMASLRFFHAIQSQSSNAISVQDSFLSNTIISGLAFGTASNYMDIIPRTKHDFVVTNTVNAGVPLAPSDAIQNGASFDVRAGLRATVICANTDMQSPTVFCRMIPSRVVAYVRLINDNDGSNYLVQSVFGSNLMKSVQLSLWASYSMPFPVQLQEMSQSVGATCARTTNAPLLSKGFYPVVTNVGVNSVSNYGEVHIPIFLMDYAVRSVIRETYCRTAVATPSYTTNTDDATATVTDTNGVIATRWFELSPVYKRVSFVIKTDGGSTLTGLATSPTIFNTLAPGDTRATNKNFLLLNEYMEPGEMFSLYTAPPATLDSTTTTLQLPKHTTFYLRKDANVAQVAAGIPTGMGNVRFIALPGQTLPQLSLSTRTAAFGPAAGFVSSFVTAQSCSVGKNMWIDAVDAEFISLAPGTYSYSAIVPGVTCTGAVPSGSFTVVAGTHLDIFVLGSYACLQTSQTVTVQQVTAQSYVLPTTVCNPQTQSPFATILSASASATIPTFVMMAVALLAALAAMF